MNQARTKTQFKDRIIWQSREHCAAQVQSLVDRADRQFLPSDNCALRVSKKAAVLIGRPKTDQLDATPLFVPIWNSSRWTAFESDFTRPLDSNRRRFQEFFCCL